MTIQFFLHSLQKIKNNPGPFTSAFSLLVTLTTNMAKKAKARVILVKLLSTAGTGFNYIKSRPRISPKLSLMKYDPMGKFIKV